MKKVVSGQENFVETQTCDRFKKTGSRCFAMWACLARCVLGEETVGVFGGGWRIRTTEGISQQIYSLPQLAALVTPQSIQPEKNTRRYFDSQDQNRSMPIAD